MRFLSLVLPVIGMGAVVVLSASQGTAFQLNGEVLDLGQRDFRIFPNFTDATANRNMEPDPDYPGASGAEMALWKGVAEWGSGPHGSGLSDPSQEQVGSGASNFDVYYLGRAIGPGNTDANVISQLDASGGGIRAFAELPSSDGWRIRFFRGPTIWYDGPGPVPASSENRFDLQGVAAHEFGHVLGLGHAAAAATMSTDTTGRGVPLRSLELDDIGGIQAIYGIRLASKARIDTYELGLAGQVTLVGENFAANGNDIWFTRLIPGGGGATIEVTGLPASAGGTRIVVDVPLDAGPGNIIVKRPGALFEDLSNPIPFDPAVEPCAPPVRIGVPKVTSIGTSPRMTITGVPSIARHRIRLGTDQGLLSGHGILFSGPTVAHRPFGGGTIHVGTPYRREASFSFNDLSARVVVPMHPSMIGTTRVYQMWFSDPGDASGVGLSDALAITFCE
ncbi:MAG: hypothetical protein ACI8QZ_002198 [Chlamydiales bacterium]|jgi:hypothetical protein